MNKRRTSFTDRSEADALNREWDAYVRTVARPAATDVGGMSAALRDLHRRDDAPAPDPAFLAATWRQLRERVPAPETPSGYLLRPGVFPSGHRRRLFNGDRRSPSVRIAVAALGVAIFALTLFAGRLLPAGDDALLVASALASERPALGSPELGIRSGTSQPDSGGESRRASASPTQPVRMSMTTPTGTVFPATPSR